MNDKRERSELRLRNVHVMAKNVYELSNVLGVSPARARKAAEKILKTRVDIRSDVGVEHRR